MIRTFADKETYNLFRGRKSIRFRSFEASALRKLDQLDGAAQLSDLKHPLGNRLEKLAGNRKGQHSIRINNQWRICFNWHDGAAENVEIADYH